MAGAYTVDVLEQFFPQGFSFRGRDEIQSRDGGVGDGRWRGGGVDERAGEVRDKIDPIAAGGKVATREADCFAECAHLEMDFLLEAEG